jgi:murein DD-endopeptidase MepM/ murein hydrolase activator NlpD
VVDPDNERTGEFVVNYYGDPATISPGWSVALDVNGRPYAYRAASHNAQTLYVAYVPRLIGRGQYVVEAFIPREHASARDVHYIIVDYPNGQRRETTAILDQSRHADAWAPLQGNSLNGAAGGPPVTQFHLDPTRDDSGRVNVADVTFVDPASGPAGRFDIAFGALRWRPAAAPPEPPAGLDAPVGTEAERRGVIPTGRLTPGGYKFWVGDWFDVNPIGTRYWLGSSWAVHTGADLNLDGSVIADKDAPVYAIGHGVVIWARWVSSGWKNVVVVEHPVPGEARVVWARYAHVADMRVQEGQTVLAGQQIAAIGQYAPNNYHLHFDIAVDPILRSVPGHWPGDNLALVRAVYTDPLAFIQKYHGVR